MLLILLNSSVTSCKTEAKSPICQDVRKHSLASLDDHLPRRAEHSLASLDDHLPRRAEHSLASLDDLEMNPKIYTVCKISSWQ